LYKNKISAKHIYDIIHIIDGGGILDFIKELKQKFSYGLNEDFIIRDIYIKSINLQGSVVFLKGMTNRDTLEKMILCPLMAGEIDKECEVSLDYIGKTLIPVTYTRIESNFPKICEAVLYGNTILVIDGFDEVIIINNAGFEHRSIERTQIENVAKGPAEAFIESGEINCSLIRKQLRDENLITEGMLIGESSSCKVYIMYLKDVANTKLIENVKTKIREIQVDSVQNIGILEQYLEERAYSLIPSILYTERPDRATAFLQEGHVILLMDTSPACLILPATFWSFFHTAEDQYERWAYGNFIRMVRLFALFIALLLPGLYIAVTNYHTESIPTDLLLAIAATRETLPLPVFVEVLLMEIAFELLREAGIRIPSPMGPTIGIVGALILGQAAVEANVISPILVVVVAMTGLSSFTIPEASLNYAVRISRFIFLILGGIFGFMGIAGGLTVYISYVSSLKSFDVPFFSPLAPHYRSSKDTIIRPPVWKQWLRPFNIKPMKKVKGKKP
jgi:spore germination protein KA